MLSFPNSAWSLRAATGDIPLTTPSVQRPNADVRPSKAIDQVRRHRLAEPEDRTSPVNQG